MARLLPAALLYFTLVFAAGAVLGTLRVIAIVPVTGELVAVALELPVMLALSWIVAGLVLCRWPQPDRAHRLAMGAVAFACLMIAEAGLGLLVFGQTGAGYLGALLSPAGLTGLAGQIAFGLIPVLRELVGPAAGKDRA